MRRGVGYGSDDVDRGKAEHAGSERHGREPAGEREAARLRAGSSEQCRPGGVRA